MDEQRTLTDLIQAAKSAALEAEIREEAEREARNTATDARNQAKEAWNAVYDELFKLKEEHRNIPAFRESRLGKLLEKVD